jgi:methionyl-tRNA synthetase
MLDLLGIPESARDFSALGGERRIAPGTQLGEVKPVFPRYVEPEAKTG